MSSSNSSRDARRGNERHSQGGGSDTSSSVTAAKQTRPPQPKQRLGNRVVLGEGGGDQRSAPSALNSFSTAPSASEADSTSEAMVVRTNKSARSSPEKMRRNETRGEELRATGSDSGIGDSSGSVAVARRRQLHLAEVVSRKAFECVVGTSGELSKRIDVDEHDSSTTAAVVNESHGEHRTKPASIDALKHGIDEACGNHVQRSSYERSPTSAWRLEPLPYGAGISIGSQRPSDGLWGLDLHWCDLESLVGFPPAEQSPWGADGVDSDKGEQRASCWRCVYLDASLNRLRDIDAITDQPGLHNVIILDVSHNLIDDLDAVQEFRRIQVLVAANNQLESARALGELAKGSHLRHLDLSHNLISGMETPRSPRSFRHLKELRLASNGLEYFEEDAAVTLRSLERVDVSDNKLNSIDWVAVLQALRFLDCSSNRLEILPTFVRALARPPGLEEVIAEGNPVVLEPQYRITVLTNCKMLRRLDHRSVDAEALGRQIHRAAEGKALAHIRETADSEYYRSVEEERARLERRKAVLKAQEQQLNDAFQEFRLQKLREAGECVAYAEHLRRKDGEQEGEGLLTTALACNFQEAIKGRRSEPAKKGLGFGDADDSDGVGEGSLSDVLRTVAKRQNSESPAAAGKAPGKKSARSSRGSRASGRDTASDDHKLAHSDSSPIDVADSDARLTKTRTHVQRTNDSNGSDSGGGAGGGAIGSGGGGSGGGRSRNGGGAEGRVEVEGGSNVRTRGRKGKGEGGETRDTRARGSSATRSSSGDSLSAAAKGGKKRQASKADTSKSAGTGGGAIDMGNSPTGRLLTGVMPAPLKIIFGALGSRKKK